MMNESPLAFLGLTIAAIRSMFSGWTPSVGSSSIASFAFNPMVRAKDNNFRPPPLSDTARWLSRRCSSGKCLKASSQRSSFRSTGTHQPTEMPCALCLQDKELRNSHIYPEWIYSPLYDNKHRLEILSVVPEGRNELKQKGMRQPLLCDDCEQKLSVWEGYAKNIFVSPSKPIEYSQEESMLEVRGLDYAPEILRKQFDTSDPGHPDQYGVLLFGLKIGEMTETLQVSLHGASAPTRGRRKAARASPFRSWQSHPMPRSSGR